jgi:hypothetical protein
VPKAGEGVTITNESSVEAIGVSVSEMFRLRASASGASLKHFVAPAKVGVQWLVAPQRNPHLTPTTLDPGLSRDDEL